MVPTDPSNDHWVTVGMLVVLWGHLEERFPRAAHPGERAGGVDVEAVAEATGIPPRELHRVRRIRNAVVHQPSAAPERRALDQAIAVIVRVLQAIGVAPMVTPADGKVPTAAKGTTMEPPTTFPNPRGDNPWDNDAVHWLLTHSDVAARFTRGPLMECLRCQPQRVREQPNRVDEAARFAARYGVIQREELDERLGKRIVRLYRTDPDRPQYPGSPPPAAGPTRA